MDPMNLRYVGGLQIAEKTTSVYLGFIAALPEDTTLSPDDAKNLYVDANVLVLSELRTARDRMTRPAQEFIKKNMGRAGFPKSTGTAARFGLL